MQFPLVASALLASHLAAAVGLDCKHIVIDKTEFDLGELEGPHSVFQLLETATGTKNTTFTVDVCGALGRSGGKHKDEECPNGSWSESRRLPMLCISTHITDSLRT